MKNKHLLPIIGFVCFLTYHIPVVYFSTYVDYNIPAWTMPLFVTAAYVPAWWHEFIFRISRFGSDIYIASHDVHFNGINWRKQRLNLLLVLRKFFGWVITKAAIWATSILVAITLWYARLEINYDELFPYVPYYAAITIWWIVFLKHIAMYRDRVEQGRISYGYREPMTKFMPEWYAEQERVRKLQQERLQKK